MMPSITQLASASDGSSGSRRRLHSAFVAAGRGRRRLQPTAESQLQRQEAEFVLVEASVRSGSGSRSELTPEVRGQQHLRDDNDDDDDDDNDEGGFGLDCNIDWCRKV